jgi:predicted CXXCH cytochrome family protein
MKRMREFMIMKKASAIVSLLLLLNAAGAYSEPAATYVGGKKCAVCHSDINDAWQKTRHAKAIESLKKSKQESLPACVKCHVTGYEKDGGFIDYELTPEMAGVQCEACHGAGSQHAESPSAKNITKESGAVLCRQCHTERQDAGFNYAVKAKAVHPK